MKKIILIPIVGLLLLFIGYYGMLFIAHDGDSNFLQIDKCLDQGGARNKEQGKCEVDIESMLSGDSIESGINNQTGTLPGSDRDPNGCIASAGYTWSIVKNECIRPFEQEVVLLSNDGTEQYGVAFSSDNKQVEIYRGSGDRPSLLTQDATNLSKYTAPGDGILQKDTNGKWIYTYNDYKFLQK